jgi:hypothetical protein
MLMRAPLVEPVRTIAWGVDHGELDEIWNERSYERGRSHTRHLAATFATMLFIVNLVHIQILTRRSGVGHSTIAIEASQVAQGFAENLRVI